jgi:hypothetical protein
VGSGSSGSGGSVKREVFQTSGTYTVPAGISKVRILIAGAGGGGGTGGSTSPSNGGDSSVTGNGLNITAGGGLAGRIGESTGVGRDTFHGGGTNTALPSGAYSAFLGKGAVGGEPGHHFSPGRNEYTQGSPGGNGGLVIIDDLTVVAGQSYTVTIGAGGADSGNDNNGSDGQSGYVIFEWAGDSIASRAIADADSDTQIQIEESSDEDKIRFDTAGSERMIIDETGNVGIGTTTPAVDLDLQGTMRMSKYTSEPYTCDATKDAAIAVTSNYTTCICRNGTGWVSTSDGETLCKWKTVAIVVNGSGKKWADDTFATSCNGYRNPTGDYTYTGLTGDGIYTIDPDGAGGSAEFDVYCDMTTDGGGWTEVFLASTDNYNSTSIGYTTSNASTIVSSATEMLFAYTNPSTHVLTNPWKFSPIPAAFNSTTPMSTGSGTAGADYSTVNATEITTSTTHSSYTLRSGSASFSGACDDAVTSTWGQICLKSNSTQGGGGGVANFPHFTSYATATSDHCSLSNQNYTTTACSSTRRFVIYVK